MKRSIAPLMAIPWWGLGLLAMASCSDPARPDTTAHPPPVNHIPGLEDCAASPEWLPITPVLAPDSAGTNSYARPAPHPETECPFYRGAWQTFLVAGQPDTRPDFAGEPAIKSFPVLDDIFQRYTPVADRLAPPGTPRGTTQRAWLGDIKQAGGREILIDQNGHTLYYGIHVNQAFVQFVQDNHLDNPYAVQNADPNLFLPPGLAEYKTAWQRVDSQDPMDADPNSPELKDYIWTTAWVPTLSQLDDGTIEEARDNPQLVTVRLLAIHSVFTIPGHPEFVWGSMEHSTADIFNGDSDTKAADGFRDVAPVVAADPVTGDLVNPTIVDATNQNNHSIVADTPPTHGDGYLLYKLRTAAILGNRPPLDGPGGNLQLDAASQKFYVKGSSPLQLASASIYRMFPASKSNETEPDGAITSLNSNVQAVFKQANLDTNDRRWHYRLVGAQWMDKPSFFQLNSRLQNDETSPLIGDPTAYGDLNQADERAKILASPPPAPAGFQCPQGASGTACTALAALFTDGSDSGFSILAGEDRMSSTAMESFTQDPNNFFNCFSCHNTQSVSAKGVPVSGTGQTKLLDPKLINVSHVFSEIVLEECSNNTVDNGDGTKTAKCLPMGQ